MNQLHDGLKQYPHCLHLCCSVVWRINDYARWCANDSNVLRTICQIQFKSVSLPSIRDIMANGSAEHTFCVCSMPSKLHYSSFSQCKDVNWTKMLENLFGSEFIGMYWNALFTWVYNCNNCILSMCHFLFWRNSFIFLLTSNSNFSFGVLTSTLNFNNFSMSCGITYD